MCIENVLLILDIYTAKQLQDTHEWVILSWWYLSEESFSVTNWGGLYQKHGTTPIHEWLTLTRVLIDGRNSCRHRIWKCVLLLENLCLSFCPQYQWTPLSSKLEFKKAGFISYYIYKPGNYLASAQPYDILTLSCPGTENFKYVLVLQLCGMSCKGSGLANAP